MTHQDGTGSTLREVVVRAATPDEAAALAPSYEWLFAAPGSRPAHWDLSTAAARLAGAAAAEGSAVLVAADSERGVGFCTVYLDLLSVRYGARAWVEDLAVAPDERSRGTGGKLLRAAMAWATDCGASHLELDSALTRTDAHRFYDRHAPDSRSMCFSWALPAGEPPMTAPQA